jgi:small-conductance mechanosensitive channel
MAEFAGPNLETLRRLIDAGYGFYRDTNRVRADDLLVRARAADSLHAAAAQLLLAEQQARRTLPAPSRENPVPDPALLAAIRDLKIRATRLASLETRLRGAGALPDRDFSAIVPTEELRNRLVSLDTSLLDCAAAAEAGTASVLDALEAAIAERSELISSSGVR